MSALNERQKKEGRQTTHQKVDVESVEGNIGVEHRNLKVKPLQNRELVAEDLGGLKPGLGGLCLVHKGLNGHPLLLNLGGQEEGGEADLVRMVVHDASPHEKPLEDKQRRGLRERERETENQLKYWSNKTGREKHDEP